MKDHIKALIAAGYINLQSQTYGHSEAILKSLDAAKCEVCGVPVGPECRGLTVCKEHAGYDIDKVGR